MHGLWIVFLFAFGACVGSFLNVVVWRLPRGESIVFPGSHCVVCGKAIRWYDNIPILSWLLLRARCRHCGAHISSRYILIELATALLLSGLYVWYFLLGRRQGIAEPAADWPVYAAHAVLLCGLLAASAVDVELFLVPLPVMWFCAAVGIVAAAGRPHSVMPVAPPALALVAAAAVVGLIIGKVLLWLGRIRESFLDAEDRPGRGGREKLEGDRAQPKRLLSMRLKVVRELLYIVPAAALGIWALLAIARGPWPGAYLRRLYPDPQYGGLASRLAGFAGILAALLVSTLWTRLARAVFTRVTGVPAGSGQPTTSVAITSEHGVKPRVEILREVLFLAPAIILAAGAWYAATRIGPVRELLAGVLGGSGGWAAHVRSGMGAVLGLLTGVGLVWGVRILGTLAFGKEAMGLGDVHILAAIGAAAGWKVTVLTFFTAPCLGVVYVLHCFAAGRRLRELPYGPWLALGALVVLLGYDGMVRFLMPAA